ncbi:hypothetical protein ACWDSD_34310 [Streptomyces spiralis]
MTDLVRISLPGKGTGFTLRQPSRWLRPDYVEFLADDGRIWLFREFSQLQEFLASDAWPAPYWRDLLEADDRGLVPDSAKQYNLFQMINGYLRWTDGYEARPCSDLCVELAFACESWELLDELGPRLHTQENRNWRPIIHLLVPMFRVWSEPDEPVDPAVIERTMTASFYHGP